MMFNNNMLPISKYTRWAFISGNDDGHKFFCCVFNRRPAPARFTGCLYLARDVGSIPAGGAFEVWPWTSALKSLVGL